MRTTHAGALMPHLPPPALPIWIWLRGVRYGSQPLSYIYDFSTNHRTVTNATGSPTNSLVYLYPETNGSVDLSAANTSLTTDVLPNVFYSVGTWRVDVIVRRQNIPKLSVSDGAILLQDAQWDTAIHGPAPGDLDRRGLYLRATSNDDASALTFSAEGYININGNMWSVSHNAAASGFGEWIKISLERTIDSVILSINDVQVNIDTGIPQGIGGTEGAGFYAPELPRALTVNRQNIFTVPSPPTYSTHVIGELQIDIDGYTSPPA